MRSNFLKDLRDLSHAKNSSLRFNSRSKDNISFVQRLKLVDSHRVHRGCVNTITWDDPGNYVLSGSDDLRLVVTDPFNGKVTLSHKTKHPTNIFCAKFLPQTQNEQVVSSSAAGHIFHTYFDREEKGISLGFNCHTGAAYELATIPNDPFVFMSCGEDCMVRWFDLRLKSSCNKEGCLEDVLVNCSKPVMSMSIHPLRPFEFAAGCSDSTVRIYDRRYICTSNCGQTQKESCLLKFACPLLDSHHHHRITSLLYSNDGTELLVSYSSEHLYLFDFKNDGRKFKSLLKTPLKNETPSSDPSLAFGCDAIKVPSSSPSPNSSSSSSSPSESQHKGNIIQGNPLIPGVSKQLPIKRLRLRGDWSDTGPQARPKKEQPTREQSSGVTSVMERMSNLMTRWFERNLIQDTESGPVLEANNSTEVGGNDDATADDNDISDGNRGIRSQDEIAGMNLNLGDLGEQDHLETQDEQLANRRYTPFPDSIFTPGNIRAPDEIQEEPIVKVTFKKSNTFLNSEKFPPSRSTDINRHRGNSERIDDGRDNREAGFSDQEGSENAFENIPSNSDNLYEDLPSGSQQQQNDEARAMTSKPAICVTNPSRFNFHSQSSDSIKNKAAKTLQTFFTDRFKNPHNVIRRAGEKISDDFCDEGSNDENSQDSDGFCFRPAITKCYKGHRNSRTLIKEASFWGSKYVMSGSDCGHIFIWDRDTTKLVMFLEGDNHVVNCLQPHPSLPVLLLTVLASSGIDYDVKIWMPTSECSAFNEEEAYQVMNRNEVMLEETRGTVTVPAEFMLRLFSSLTRIRRESRMTTSPRNNSSSE